MSWSWDFTAVDEKGVRGRDELGVCDGWMKRLEKPDRLEARAAELFVGRTNFLDVGVYYPWSVAWDLLRPASGKSVSITWLGICEGMNDVLGSSKDCQARYLRYTLGLC